MFGYVIAASHLGLNPKPPPPPPPYTPTNTHTHTHAHIYMYINKLYVFMHVYHIYCVCVCVLCAYINKPHTLKEQTCDTRWCMVHLQLVPSVHNLCAHTNTHARTHTHSAHTPHTHTTSTHTHTHTHTPDLRHEMVDLQLVPSVHKRLTPRVPFLHNHVRGCRHITH